MKNIYLYYFTILTPLAFLIYLVNTDLIDSLIFVLAMLFYSTVYRTYTDGKRLANKNIISHSEIWRIPFPGKQVKYFRELYIEK